MSGAEVLDVGRDAIWLTIQLCAPVLVVGLIVGVTIGAVAELITALLSFYACGAVVLNTFFGRVFLPVGKPFGIFK